MSTPRDDGMEREWDIKERALRAERAGEALDDPGLAPYRLVARALRTPLVEVWLERGLVALLVATLVYSRDSLLALSFSVPERAALNIQTAATWSLAVAACVGFFSVLVRVRRP